MILGLGTVLVDQQMVLPVYPQADTKNEALATRLQVGGPVPTALVLLAKWNHDCHFVGKWGDDAWGRYIDRDLQTERVNTQRSVVTPNGSTGQAHVWIDQRNAERTVAFSRGTCGLLEPCETKDLDLRGCALLHLDGWSADAALQVATNVKQTGGQIVLDSGSPKPNMEQLFPLVDLMNCPARFAAQFFGDTDTDRAAARLLGLGVKRVVFTHGASGAVCYDGQQRHEQTGFQIDAVDTNGAGDVFCGALIHAQLHHWSPSKTLRFAAATAALKCRRIGNRDALPGLAEVAQFLSEQTD